MMMTLLIIRTICYAILVIILLHHAADKWVKRHQTVSLIHLGMAIYFVCLTYFAITRDDQIVTYFMTPALVFVVLLSACHVHSRLRKRD